jgi:hypothetical protein
VLEMLRIVIQRLAPKEERVTVSSADEALSIVDLLPSVTIDYFLDSQVPCKGISVMRIDFH